jgi:hypothetical protein
MIDGSAQLNVAKVARASRSAFTASLTLVIAVDGAHSRVGQATNLGSHGAFIVSFWKLNVDRYEKRQM